MKIVSDKPTLKAMTRRGQARTVIAELRRQKIKHKVAHDGWPVAYIPDDGPTNNSTPIPNWEALQ